MWTMLIVLMQAGTFSNSAAFQTVPFQNKQACVTAATEFRKGSSKTVGFICVSAETGELIKFIAE